MRDVRRGVHGVYETPAFATTVFDTTRFAWLRLLIRLYVCITSNHRSGNSD